MYTLAADVTCSQRHWAASASAWGRHNLACWQHLLMRQSTAYKSAQVKAQSNAVVKAYQQGHKAAAIEHIVSDGQRVVIGISTCTLQKVRPLTRTMMDAAATNQCNCH